MTNSPEYNAPVTRARVKKRRSPMLTSLLALFIAFGVLTVGGGVTLGLLYKASVTTADKESDLVDLAYQSWLDRQAEEESARAYAAAYLSCYGWICDLIYDGYPISDYADAVQKTKIAEAVYESFVESEIEYRATANRMQVIFYAGTGAGLAATIGLGVAFFVTRSRVRRRDALAMGAGAGSGATAGTMTAGTMTAGIIPASTARPAAPAEWTCANCGQANASGLFCLNCGQKHGTPTNA